MALEGLAALGLASNIVQFVEFGCRLFSQSKELYRSSSGLLDEAVELDNIARSLSRLSDNLIVEHKSSSHDSDIELRDVVEHVPPIQPAKALGFDSGGGGGGETDLVPIATDCKKVADELSEALSQLRVQNPRKRWQCFRVTLKRIWKHVRIDDMSRRMERLSSQMTMCLVQNLK